MASNLDEQLKGILTAAEEKEKFVETTQKVDEQPKEVGEDKKDSEDSGVQKAADDSNVENNESNDSGGEDFPSDLEEEFKNLDPEVREALSKADAETRKAQANAFKKMRASFDRKQTELGQKKKIAEQAEQVFQEIGIDPINGLSQVKNLLNFERELERNPKKVIDLLKTRYSVKDEVAGSNENNLDESLLTDEERVIYKQQQDIKKTLESLVEENRKLKEQKESEEVEKARREIINLKAAKNEDGSPMNPYFDELASEIGKLANLYPSATLQDLYSKALRLNDDLYKKSIEEVALRERKRIEKEEAAKKAKNLNSQTLKSSTRSTSKPSLDDELSNIYDRAIQSGNL